LAHDAPDANERRSISQLVDDEGPLKEGTDAQGSKYVKMNFDEYLDHLERQVEKQHPLDSKFWPAGPDADNGDSELDEKMNDRGDVDMEDASSGDGPSPSDETDVTDYDDDLDEEGDQAVEHSGFIGGNSKYAEDDYDDDELYNEDQDMDMTDSFSVSHDATQEHWSGDRS
jgi:hypothetical protein